MLDEKLFASAKFTSLFTQPVSQSFQHEENNGSRKQFPYNPESFTLNSEKTFFLSLSCFKRWKRKLSDPDVADDDDDMSV